MSTFHSDVFLLDVKIVICCLFAGIERTNQPRVIEIFNTPNEAPCARVRPQHLIQLIIQ